MSVNNGPQVAAINTEIPAVQNVIKKDIASSIGPQATVEQGPATAFAAKADSTRFGLVKFGMERSPHAGCCITRFTGGKSGCCEGIKSGKPFEREYIKAVERDIKEKGDMPKLEPKVIAKLKEMKENDVSEYDRLHALAKTHAKEKPKVVEPTLSASDANLLKAKNKLVAFFNAPFRWVKWLAIGFWADMKQIIAGRRA